MVEMEGMLALAIPFGLVVVLPTIGILTSHQRKMAEIYANRAMPVADPEIAMLRQEIRELKELVHQQAIALDSSTPPPVRIEDRISNGGV